jgi:hypothetical protein
MRSAVVLLCAAVLVAGCTTADLHRPPLGKPGAGIGEISQDDLECRRLARDIPGTPETYVGGVADLVRTVIEEGQRQGIYERCMTSRGYVRVG